MIRVNAGGYFDRVHPDTEISGVQALIEDLHLLREGRHPSPAERVGAPSINQWVISGRPAPCLIGPVQGHPRLTSLSLAVTSDLEVINTARLRPYSQLLPRARPAPRRDRTGGRSVILIRRIHAT